MSFLLPPLPPTLEAALRDIHARTPELRIAAAERLAEPDEDSRARAVEGLTTLAGDPDPRVRSSALRSMAQLAAPSFLPTLAARLDDPHGAVRELAVVALEAVGSAEALGLLERSLRSPHPEVRFQAVIGCVQRDPSRDPAPIRRLLSDPDARVRANAARAYAQLLPQPTTDALLGLLDDPHPDVAYEAALALARLGSGAGAQTLLDALRDGDRVLDALDALGGLEGFSTLEPIRNLTLNVLKPLVIKVAAARALLRLGDTHGVVALREVLRAFRSDGRSFAVEVIAELALQELRPELERLARRPRGVDPEQILAALARLRA